MNYNNHPKMKHVYVGIDCHKHTHTAAVINPFNETLDMLTFSNDIKDFEKLIKMVNKYETDGITAIYGLEDIKHLGHHLATFLINRNLDVRHILSSLTYAERKKRPIVSKTDEIDAECIAKVLLDNLDYLSKANNDTIYWTLKQVVKMRSSIVNDNTKAKNKLHSQLMHHYPNYKDFFGYFDCHTALELWKTYPSPNLLKELSFEELNEFIYTNSKGHLNKERSKKIYDLVHNTNYNNLGYQEERNVLITTIVNQIQSNNKQIEELETTIVDLYDKLELKLHTINGLSKMTSAEIMAEIGNINRFSSSSKLARYSGIAPINFSSGGSDKEIRNEYGNRRLNTHIYNLAIRSINPGKYKDNPQNAIFLDYYNRKLSEGKNEQQALTCVMRRLINIIYRMVKNNTEFYMPKELEEKCKIKCLEKIKEDKEKEEKKEEKNAKKITKNK